MTFSHEKLSSSRRLPSVLNFYSSFISVISAPADSPVATMAIPSLPSISAQSAPGAAVTTSSTTRSLPARHDSSAPPHALFSSGVRSLGTGEGKSAEQTRNGGHSPSPATYPKPVQSSTSERSVTQSVQSTRVASNRSDHAIPPSVTTAANQYPDSSRWAHTVHAASTGPSTAYQHSSQDARAETAQGRG
jgi:hypothetical protein